MPRRKNSTLNSLTDLVAMLPWWVGVAMAFVIYVVLRWVAGQPEVSAAQPGQIGAMVMQSAWRAFAAVGQYGLPLICLAGAGISAWRRHERKTLVNNVVQSKAASVLDGMTWSQFEKLVGEVFRLQGYTVTESGGGGPDGGVDLVLSFGGEKHLVQCKQWKAFRVGVDVVRELYGVMAAKGAAGGFVVTSGRFTDDAINFASGRNVKLIDGPTLHGLIRQAQASDRRDPASPTQPTVSHAKTSGGSSAPTCPLCSNPMIMRRARRGANASGEFWGCTGYPTCKGSRQVS